MAHPELRSRGLLIVESIEKIIDDMGDDHPMGLHHLPELLGEVVNYIDDVLCARGPNGSAAADTGLLA